MTLVFLIFFNAFAYAQSPNVLYQASTINAILQGIYDGEVTIKELRE